MNEAPSQSRHQLDSDDPEGPNRSPSCQRSDVVHPRSRRPSDDLRRFNPRRRLLTVDQFFFSISTACRQSHQIDDSGQRWVVNSPTIRVNFAIPHTPDYRSHMSNIHIKARWTIAEVPHQVLFSLISPPFFGRLYTRLNFNFLPNLCHHPLQPNQPALSCLPSQLSRNSTLPMGPSYISLI